MANEITFTGSLTVYKSSVMSAALGRSITALLRNMGANFITEGSISIATTATAIPLGQVVQPHWAFFINMDPTNYLTLANGAAGAIFARLLAGDPAFVPLDPACVPYGIANTGACVLEYLIASL